MEALRDMGGAPSAPMTAERGGAGGVVAKLAEALGGPVGVPLLGAGLVPLDRGGGGVAVEVGVDAAPSALLTHFLISGSKTKLFFSPRLALTGLLDFGSALRFTALASFLKKLPNQELFC
jgi:hypothetical protein